MTHSEPSSRWPPVLLAAGVPLLLVVATAWRWPQQLGNVGAWLHLGGLLVVAYGLIETRCQLRGTSAGAVIRGALASLFKRWRRPDPVHVEVESAGSFTLAGSASVRVGAPRSGTDREMIEWLEQELHRLDGRLDREVSRLEKDRSAGDEKVEGQVREEAAARQAAVQEVQDHLRRLTIGGLRIEAVGITWLASGFLVATWPEWVLWLWNLLPLPAP